MQAVGRNAHAASCRRRGPGVRVDTYGYEGYTHQSGLRSAAGQAHRAGARLHARDGPRQARAARVRDRRRRDQHLRSCTLLLENPDVAGRRDAHALRRGKHRRTLAAAASWKPNDIAPAPPAAQAAPGCRIGRTRRHRRRRGADAGQDREHRREARRRRAQGRSRRRARSDEDGASGRRERLRPRAFDRRSARRRFCSKATRCSSSVPRKSTMSRTKRRTGGVDPDVDPARSRGIHRAPCLRLSTKTVPTPSRAAARPTSAPRARTSPDLVDPGSFIEYGALAFAAQTPPPHARRSDQEHARRRHHHRHRHRERRAVRRGAARAAPCWPTTTPCSPARRAR